MPNILSKICCQASINKQLNQIIVKKTTLFVLNLLELIILQMKNLKRLIIFKLEMKIQHIIIQKMKTNKKKKQHLNLRNKIELLN